MTLRHPGPVWREAMIAGALAASVAALLLWLGPPGNDLAAHVYQRALFLKHGFVLWNNFWYAGRYSFVTYSILYYPLAALLGIKVLALATIAVAALAFAVVVGQEWGPVARWSSRTFAVVWAGTVLSAAFPFALGAALALLAVWALQGGHRRRFVLLVVLTLAASPLAFAFLAILLLGIYLARRPSLKAVALPVCVVGLAAFAELVIVRLFPDGGRFPFHAMELIPVVAFCALGALVSFGRGRALAGIYIVYLVACVLAFAVPTALGSNIERLRYAAIPLAVLSVSLVAWRPLRLAVSLVVVAGFWNVTPLVANFRHATSDHVAAAPAYWRPAIRFLNRQLAPSYRVEAVDTVEHWPAVFLPDAGIQIVRGWYRQNDFPTNAILYGRFGAAAYRRWLRGVGVKYVLLSDAPPDYSSRAEAALVRRGTDWLRPVFHTKHITIYEVQDARPLVTGPASATIRLVQPTRIFVDVGAPGDYRLAVRFSPYWRTFQGCVARTEDGMTRLTAFRAGLIDLDFKVNVHRGLEVLSGLEPARFCRA
jgi:hypothetical protein